MRSGSHAVRKYRKTPRFRLPSRSARKSVPTTKLLGTPFSTSINSLSVHISGFITGNPARVLHSAQYEHQRTAGITCSWKALATVWLPGRNRWIETTFGVHVELVHHSSRSNVIVTDPPALLRLFSVTVTIRVKGFDRYNDTTDTTSRLSARGVMPHH